MAKILVVGGGVIGLCTGMLLAKDGNEVTVLERDGAAPPAPEDAWDEWERRGVNQFRMLHFFASRFRSIVEAELPEVAAAMDAAGALRFNPLAGAPVEMTGGMQPGDEKYEVLTGRRPVIESAVASASAATAGLTIRRGAGVAALLATEGKLPGVPHVVGVRTEDGEELTADLVIDATGRRSPLPRWLDAIGAAAPHEEMEDSGFVYYGRHFRSADGSVPPAFGPLLMDYGTVSTLTLPADNGTWGIGIISSAKDAELRGLRDLDRWSTVVSHFPLIAHWADGEPLDAEIAVMAKIEDRLRHVVVDGSPIVTGLLPVADAWGCTNPSLGRGVSIGLIHAVALRDHLRAASMDDPVAMARDWHEATEATVAPWYTATNGYDRHRLAEIESLIRGEPYEPDDVSWEMTKALLYGAGQDSQLLRGFLRIASVIETPDEVFAEPGLMDKAITVGASWRDADIIGPKRDELVKLAAD